MDLDFEPDEPTEVDARFDPPPTPMNWQHHESRWAGASDEEIRRACRSTTNIQTEELPRFEG